VSTLSAGEALYFEKLLGMGSGYVLDFNDGAFASFFRRHAIDIHNAKYQSIGTSKAKKLRAFWELDPDLTVGRVLGELLDRYEANCDVNGQPRDAVPLEKARATIARLLGQKTSSKPAETEDAFLKHEFSIPNLNKLPIIPQAVPIVEARLAEARVALQAKASLSVIFLCGSVLEAVLLGAAQQEPEKFNRTSASAKDKAGSVKPFQEWSLAQLIDAACEAGVLKVDVKKFSHGLRDFRNYIHPYEQMLSGFAPDEHTARVCFHVLKAALASVAGDRR
jgi:hypothetical protein